MHTSRVIEIDGQFVGAAMALTDGKGWRFKPAHERLMALSGHTAASFAELERVVRGAFHGGRMPAPAAASAA